MVLSNAASRLPTDLPSSNSDSPSLMESVQEAASDLAKRSKVKTAEEALYVGDLQANMDAQRESIRRYEDMKVFGNEHPDAPQQGGRQAGIVICDDYRVDNSTRPEPVPTVPSVSGKLPVAAAIVAAAIAAWSLTALSLLPSDSTPPEPVDPVNVTTPIDTDTKYGLQFVE